MASVLASPLVVMDFSVSSLLWLHTMVFQLTMYGVYLGLFVFCHATGLTHKLERPETKVVAMQDLVVEVQLKSLEERTEDESGYLSDTDCDD